MGAPRDFEERNCTKAAAKTTLEIAPMKKVGSLFVPDHEIKWTKYGDAIEVYGKQDRDAAYGYVKRWHRALDLGANVGIFARDFAARFEEVVAFEPMPLTRECLAANVPSNVRIEEYAISDHRGVLEMFRAEGSGGSFVLNHPAVVLPDAEHFRVRTVEVQAQTVVVPTRTIDSFEFDAVDLMKLDIQGAEYVALTGARETILRCKPVVLVEEKAFSDAHAESIQQTADLLVAYGMTPKEKVRTDRIYVFED